MADFKENMYRRLRSARQWLMRAEEAFDKDRDIRAELDLMLAQAELQHAKEANRTRHWRYKYSLLTQGAAVGLAMMLTVAGFGGTYWWVTRHQTKGYTPPAVQKEMQQPQPTAAVNSVPDAKVKDAAPAENVKPVSAPATDKTVHHQKSITAENRIKEDEQPHQAEKEVALPPDEMQKLVRAAGKSLRGQ